LKSDTSFLTDHTPRGKNSECQDWRTISRAGKSLIWMNFTAIGSKIKMLFDKTKRCLA